MRQPNGCSTPAPRSNAAKQWLEELAQKKKTNERTANVFIDSSSPFQTQFCEYALIQQNQ